MPGQLFRVVSHQFLVKEDLMRNGYRWVFFSLGVIFILVAAIDDLTLVRESTGGVPIPKLASIAKDTLLAVGVAILAVSVIDVIWSNLGGDPLATEIHNLAMIKDLFSDADQTGLARVHGTVLSSSPKIEWINLIDFGGLPPYMGSSPPTEPPG
jgi:hypothetical protein